MERDDPAKAGQAADLGRFIQTDILTKEES